MVMTDIWAGLLLLASDNYGRTMPEEPPQLVHMEDQPTVTASSNTDRLQSPDVNDESQANRRARSPCTISPRDFGTDGPPPEWMNLRLANRYFDFAKAIYGWPNYVWDNLSCGGVCGLCRAARCCFGPSCVSGPTVIQEDNCCMCHSAAFRLVTGLEETDLFHLSYHNKIYEVPFVVAVDHATRAVVIAIRGSMSLQDAITDMCAREHAIHVRIPAPSQSATPNRRSSSNSNPPVMTPLQPTAKPNGDSRGETSANGVPQPDIRPGQPFVNTFPNTPSNVSPLHQPVEEKVIQSHAGIARSAEWLAARLESDRILFDLSILHPDYNLVLTGHSLGAGVAAVLSLLLAPDYPAVRAFAFGPPGGVLAGDALPLARRRVMSVVVGDDFVPRLSIQSLRRLKTAVVNAVASTDRPKAEILIKGCFRLLVPQQPSDGTADDGAHERTDEQSSPRRMPPGTSHDWTDEDLEVAVPQIVPSVAHSSSLAVPFNADNGRPHLTASASSYHTNTSYVPDTDTMAASWRTAPATPIAINNASDETWTDFEEHVKSPSSSVLSQSPARTPTAIVTPDNPSVSDRSPLLQTPHGRYNSTDSDGVDSQDGGEVGFAAAPGAPNGRSPLWTRSAMMEPRHVGEDALEMLVPLFIPGRILHIPSAAPPASALARTVRYRRLESFRHGRPAWRSAEDFRTIVLSARMVRDHMPGATSAALHQALVESTDPNDLPTFSR